MWVFGYGSLMWDSWEQTRGCLSSKLATLRDYERSFNKKSTRNWGTTAAPGPTLGIEPCNGAIRVGMAFEFRDTARGDIESYLREREGASFTLTELSVSLPDGSTVSGLTAINDRNAKTYVGNLSLDQRVTMAKLAKGTSGSCVNYVRGVRDKLRALGITDPKVEEFAEKL